MVRIDVATDAVVVEGELLKEACEQFRSALESLRRSRITQVKVNLSRVTAAAYEPIGLLYALWLELSKGGRAPYIDAPAFIWQMLGRAAVEQGLLKSIAGDHAGRTRPDGPLPASRRASSSIPDVRGFATA